MFINGTLSNTLETKFCYLPLKNIYYCLIRNSSGWTETECQFTSSWQQLESLSAFHLLLDIQEVRGVCRSGRGSQGFGQILNAEFWTYPYCGFFLPRFPWTYSGYYGSSKTMPVRYRIPKVQTSHTVGLPLVKKVHKYKPTKCIFPFQRLTLAVSTSDHFLFSILFSVYNFICWNFYPLQATYYAINRSKTPLTFNEVIFNVVS